jgi:hypothetical protein
MEAILALGAEATDDGLPATTGSWLAILAPYTWTPVTILHTLGAAVAALGVVLLLVPYQGRTTGPLAAAGSMTLTLYSAHVVIMATEILDPEHPIVSITIQAIVFLLAAVLWRAAMGKSPSKPSSPAPPDGSAPSSSPATGPAHHQDTAARTNAPPLQGRRHPQRSHGSRGVDHPELARTFPECSPTEFGAPAGACIRSAGA